jgi:hypothetical protein
MAGVGRGPIVPLGYFVLQLMFTKSSQLKLDLQQYTGDFSGSHLRGVKIKFLLNRGVVVQA